MVNIGLRRVDDALAAQHPVGIIVLFSLFILEDSDLDYKLVNLIVTQHTLYDHACLQLNGFNNISYDMNV